MVEAAEAALEHIAGALRDLADMISHVPTRLLAVDAVYPGRHSPGRHSREQEREIALRALTQSPSFATSPKAKAAAASSAAVDAPRAKRARAKRT